MSETVKRPDPSIAARALAEAKARKDKQQAHEGKHVAPKELGGRGGEDPARFGDWEVKGIAHDF
jgi:hypothetical protein